MKKLFTVLALVTSLMGCYGAFKHTDIEGTWQSCGSPWGSPGSLFISVTFTKTNANTPWTAVNSSGIEKTGIVHGEFSVETQEFDSEDCTGVFNTLEPSEPIPAYYQLKNSFVNNQGYVVQRLIFLDEQLKTLTSDGVIYRQGDNLYFSKRGSTDLDFELGLSLVEE